MPSFPFTFVMFSASPDRVSSWGKIFAWVTENKEDPGSGTGLKRKKSLIPQAGNQASYLGQAGGIALFFALHGHILTVDNIYLKCITMPFPPPQAFICSLFTWTNGSPFLTLGHGAVPQPKHRQCHSHCRGAAHSTWRRRGKESPLPPIWPRSSHSLPPLLRRALDEQERRHQNGG